MPPNTFSAIAKASFVPPHMKVSVAFCAPVVPPETGASSDSMPAAWASSWAFLADATSIVDASMKRVPFLADCRMPEFW